MQKLFLSALLLFAYITANTCTTFFINKNDQLVFGRNYDWITDAGMICTNLKGLSKTSMKTADGPTINWVSQYGSITFNQYGKEFPMGGMNEKGLVVELMWLDETKYPTPDARPAVGVLQWIQYQLDNSATIDDVIGSDKKLRIASVGTTPLHYLVADAKGQAATIEFLDGKMIVHKGKDLAMPVLTNSTYDQSLSVYRGAAEKGGATSFEFGNNSLERFAQACNMLKEFKENTSDYPAVSYAFDILAEVAQGSATKWSIVYDISNKTIHFKTHRFTEIKQVSFSSFDFTCKSTAKAWDMNQKASGIINDKFENFSAALNKRIVETAFRESNSRINVSDKTKESAWQYYTGINCQ